LYFVAKKDDSPMHVPFFGELDDETAEYVIIRNSGKHTGSGGEVKREQAQTDARLMWRAAALAAEHTEKTEDADEEGAKAEGSQQKEGR
jgi:hypothetical protein